MSLILDALKKAEQDRHAGQAPVLDDMLVRRAPVARRRESDAQQIVLMACAIAALLFAAAGIAYWLWPSSSPAAAPATAAAAPSPPVAANNEPALRVDPERLVEPVTDVPEEPLPGGDTEAALAMTMDELDGEPPAGKPARETAVTEALAETPAAPALAPPAPAAAAAAPPPETPAAAPVAVVAAPPPPPAETAVRPLKEMPPAFRSEFPRLVLDVHVYNDNPLRRFVLINGKKYRETDTLLDGPRVVEITPAGVIVEHRGSRVLVQLPG